MPTRIKNIVVPDSAEGLAELLADDDKRSTLFGDAESTQEFLAAYNRAVNQGDLIGRQVSEQVQATLVEWLQDSGGEVQGRPDYTGDEIADAIRRAPKTSAQAAALHNPAAPGAPGDKIGLNGLGDMAKLIWARRPPATDEARSQMAILEEITNAYSSVDPATGGFLIPEEMRSQILSLALEQSVVRSRATVIRMQSSTTSVPYVDVTSHSSSLFGGLIWYWTPESQALTNSEAKFGRVKLEANKLTGSGRIPNELFADAPALTSFLERSIPQGLAWFEDEAFLNGNGADQPKGVTNANAVVSITRDTTSEVNFSDIANMYSRMLPQSLGSAVWVINQTVLPSLMQLTIDVGTGGSAIGLVNSAGAPFMTMLGRPIVITEKVPALASAGDINFIDFGYYLIGDRQAVSMESSAHSRFANDETELRIIERVDGRPWVQSALTPKNGSTLSPYIQLAA